MRICRTILAIFLLTPLLAPAADIFPVKGEPFKAEVISITDKDLVYKEGDKEVTKPLKEILKIDYREVGKIAAGGKYALVELTDGTQLAASKWLMKKKVLEITLLAGPTLKLPSTMVASVLNPGQDETARRDWKSRVFNMRGKEAVVVKRKVKSGEVISSLECTLGEGDETGTKITFAVEIGGVAEEGKRDLAALQGIIFKSTLPATATAANCKLLDTHQNVVMVSSLSVKEGSMTLTTPAGAKIELKRDEVARLDYTKGRQEYVSDLEPSKMVAKSNLDDEPYPWFVFKDSNLNKGPLTLGGTTYYKGLAIKPHVELTYDLKGEYVEFECVVGIDDNVSALGATTLVIERDGKEIKRLTISSDDKKRFQTVLLNIKDAQRLRFIVQAEGDFDTSRHLDLADAKLRKE